MANQRVRQQTCKYYNQATSTAPGIKNDNTCAPPVNGRLKGAVATDEAALESNSHFLDSLGRWEGDDDELRRSLIRVPTSLLVAVEQMLLAKLFSVAIQHGGHFAREGVAAPGGGQ